MVKSINRRYVVIKKCKLAQEYWWYTGETVEYSKRRNMVRYTKWITNRWAFWIVESYCTGNSNRKAVCSWRCRRDREDRESSECVGIGKELAAELAGIAA